jgi:hypothetical protein
MTGHDLWHMLVLGSTLMGAAGGLLLLTAPLVFDEPPPGLVKARPAVGALVLASVLLLVLEWLGIH